MQIAKRFENVGGQIVLSQADKLKNEKMKFAERQHLINAAMNEKQNTAKPETLTLSERKERLKNYASYSAEQEKQKKEKAKQEHEAYMQRIGKKYFFNTKWS